MCSLWVGKSGSGQPTARPHLIVSFGGILSWLRTTSGTPQRHRLPRRSASECGRLRHGDGATRGRPRPESVYVGYPHPRPDKQITLDDTVRRGGDDERTSSPETHEDLPSHQVGIGVSASSQLRICRRSLQCQRSSRGSPLYDRRGKNHLEYDSEEWRRNLRSRECGEQHLLQRGGQADSGTHAKGRQSTRQFFRMGGGWRSNGLSQDRVWSLQERDGRAYATGDSSPVYGWSSV